MKILTNNIIGITVGIRFARSFRMRDISGSVVDNILYSKRSPFDTNFFPKVQENSVREKTLFNEDTSEYLRINTDDLIIGIKIDNDFQKKYDWLKKRVLPYFSNILFLENEIKNIRRFGIIFSHKISKNNKLSDAVSLLTDNTLYNVDNINISFSKKSITDDGLIKQGVNDYKNTIYNFSEMKDEIRADLDYQYYYEPPVEDLRECFVDKIFDDAKSFLERMYYKWLIKYENE